MSELRAGIIGFGYTGKLHLRTWQQTPDTRVVGVVDTNPATLAEAPEDLQRCEDYRELLAQDLDAVSICLPNALHRDVTLDALAAGCHVLLEKPIATNFADAEAMIAAARQGGRTLYVGMTHRFYPEVREAYRLVQDGAIGDVVFLRDCVYEHFGFLNSPNWYLDPQHAGAGIVLSSGIHLVDRVLWFAGEMPSCVRGSMSNSFLHHSVEDAAQMSLEFPGGRSAQLSFGFLAEPHPLVSDLEIVGTRGSIIVHTWRGYELHTRAGTSVRDWYTDHPHMEKVLVGLRGEVAEFCRAIRNGSQPWPNVEESTRALQVVMEFYRAARSRVR